MTVNEKEFELELEDTLQGRFLTFMLGDENYGIQIRYVTEIIGMQSINTLPEVPEYIRGVINLRGKITPIIDMRLKFKKKPIDYTDRTCIVVIDTGEMSTGLIVDRVSEVVKINAENIMPPPSVKTGIQNRYLQGIGLIDGQIKLLIDCEKLFRDEEIQAINGIDRMVS